MLTQKELLALKHSLPRDWVERVMPKVNYSASAIRQVLRLEDKYNAEIVDAIIAVAKEYKAEGEATLLQQKQQIKELAS